MRNLLYLSSAILVICVGLTQGWRSTQDLELTGRRYLQKKLCEILTENTTNNVVFSPFSLNLALSILYHGSEGEAKQALQSLLNLGKPEQIAIGYEILLDNMKYIYFHMTRLNVAMKLFVSKDIKLLDDFKTLAKKYYAEEENVDFIDVENAAATMNDWVSKQTRDKIKRIIKATSIEPLTSLVLVSVVDFLSNWSLPFRNMHDDVTQLFYVSEESNVKCEFITVVADDIEYVENKALDAKIVILPYQGESFNLILLLPNKRMGYVDLQKKLHDTNPNILQGLERRRGRVTLPKFQIETEIDLKEPLSQAGLEVLFSNRTQFPHISVNAMQVRELKQTLSFKVDLSGTHGTASVSQEKEYLKLGLSQPMMAASDLRSDPPAPIKQFEFKADHPFLFFVEYVDVDSYTIFQGRVTNVQDIAAHR